MKSVKGHKKQKRASTIPELRKALTISKAKYRFSFRGGGETMKLASKSFQLPDMANIKEISLGESEELDGSESHYEEPESCSNSGSSKNKYQKRSKTNSDSGGSDPVHIKKQKSFSNYLV